MQHWFKYSIKFLSRRHFRICFAVLALFGFVLDGDQLEANTNTPDTEEEFSRLPPYCREKFAKRLTGQKSISVEGIRMEKFVGTACYARLDHYCRGLHAINTAMGARTRQQRDMALRSAIKEDALPYPLSQHDNTCDAMAPEIWLNWGKTLVLLDKGQEAAHLFELAIRKKPEFIQPYLSLAHLYQRSGQKNVARQILEQALLVEPGNQEVNDRLNQIKTGNH